MSNWHAIAAVAVALFVGCGASDPEGVVGSFVSDWRDGNYASACEKLTREGEFFVSLAAISAGADEGTPCDEDLERLEDGASIEEVDVIDADETEDGQSARVETEQGTWELEEVDGEWKIADVPVIDEER